jgi:hypothetical protein
VKELLLVDRQPWRLEPYRLQGDRLVCEATAQPDDEQPLSSNVVPLTFGLVSQSDRPHIKVSHTASDKIWLV